jgi:hypothetical protein
MRDGCAELAERRKCPGARECGNRDGADALLHLLPQLQNRPEPIHELRRESGQPLARCRHGRFKMGAGQCGQRFSGSRWRFRCSSEVSRNSALSPSGA